MIIRVLGKAHKEGVSKKTDKPYNFTEIHYVGNKYGVVGLAGLTTTVDVSQFPFDRIVVDSDYNVEFDNVGRVINFVPVK